MFQISWGNQKCNWKILFGWHYCQAVIDTLEILLQETLSSRQNGFRLSKCLNFLIPRLLTNVEVLQSEVASLVQICVFVHVLLLFGQCGVLAFLSSGLISLALRLLTRLVCDVPRFLLYGLIGIFDELLVRLLGIGLTGDGLCFQLLSFTNDLLDHAEHATGTGRLLVLLETCWWWWTSWLLLHLKKCLLVKDLLQNIKSRSQELLCGTLISNSLLEIGILLLAIFTGALCLCLHFCDLALESFETLLKFCNV